MATTAIWSTKFVKANSTWTLKSIHTWKGNRTEFTSSGYLSKAEAEAEGPLYCYAVLNHKKDIKKKWQTPNYRRDNGTTPWFDMVLANFDFFEQNASVGGGGVAAKKSKNCQDSCCGNCRCGNRLNAAESSEKKKLTKTAGSLETGKSKQQCLEELNLLREAEPRTFLGS